MSSVTLRDASVDDIPFLAEVMNQAMRSGTGRGVFDTSLQDTGVAPLDFHAALLRARASHWAQLESFVVAVDAQGEAAGAIGAFVSGREEDLRPLTPEGLERVAAELGWSAEVSRAFWWRYVRVFGLFGKAPQLALPAEYTLEYGYIRPDMRGQGLHGVIVEAHVARARVLGCKSIGSTAMNGNEAVLKSLLRSGFRVHARHDADFYRGVFPGLTRLIRDL